MSLLDQIRRALQAPAASTWAAPPSAPAAPAARTVLDEDERAVERYRYLLRTASPDELEQVHAEAFARLTPDQRRQLLDGLAEGSSMTAAQRTAVLDDPRALARVATRSEVRRPGTLERVLGGPGASTGRVLAGGLLAGVAGAVVGSLVIDGLFDTGPGDSGLFDLGPDQPWAGGGGFGGGGFDGGWSDW